MFLDLIGTCHSRLQQPFVLKPEHLVLHQHHCYRRQASPSALSAMQQDREVDLDRQSGLCLLEEVTFQTTNKNVH